MQKGKGCGIPKCIGMSETLVEGQDPRAELEENLEKMVNANMGKPKDSPTGDVMTTMNHT